MVHDTGGKNPSVAMFHTGEVIQRAHDRLNTHNIYLACTTGSTDYVGLVEPIRRRQLKDTKATMTRWHNINNYH
jgi:hypothetical protein